MIVETTDGQPVAKRSVKTCSVAGSLLVDSAAFAKQWKTAPESPSDSHHSTYSEKLEFFAVGAYCLNAFSVHVSPDKLSTGTVSAGQQSPILLSLRTSSYSEKLEFFAVVEITRNPRCPKENFQRRPKTRPSPRARQEAPQDP
jgi:hypothetical protein